MRFLNLLSLCIFLLTVYCYKPLWTMMIHIYVKILPPNYSRWLTKAGLASRPLRAALEVATEACGDHLKMTAPSISFVSRVLAFSVAVIGIQ